MNPPTAAEAREALEKIETWPSGIAARADIATLRAFIASAEQMGADAEKSERRAITFGDIVHQQILAMRAAVVAWQRESPQAGMCWIANTLEGPGHLPGEEDIALGAQALFDKQTAEHEAFRAAHPAPAVRPRPPTIDAARAQPAQGKEKTG